jgi:predicted DsbA family dithiol-disulfide isomerase
LAGSLPGNKWFSLTPFWFRIKEDIEEGDRVGVTGTPGFFMNGRLVSGAQPLEAFARVIDDELARIAAAQSGSHYGVGHYL